MTSVLTWTDADLGTGALESERLRRLNASHHGMWNYLTYRDAIGLLGLDAQVLRGQSACRRGEHIVQSLSVRRVHGVGGEPPVGAPTSRSTATELTESRVNPSGTQVGTRRS